VSRVRGLLGSIGSLGGGIVGSVCSLVIELVQISKVIVSSGLSLLLELLLLLLTRVGGTGTVLGMSRITAVTGSLSNGNIELLLSLVAKNLGLLKGLLTLGHGNVSITLEGVGQGFGGSSFWESGVVAFVVVVVVVHDEMD